MWVGKREGEVRSVGRVGLLGLGGGLGFLAGVTGIGGGIYLAPVLHGLRAGGSKEIAAVATFFILVNSLVGVLVLVPNASAEVGSEVGCLSLAVLVGGFLGSRWLQRGASAVWVKRLTGLFVCVVGVRVLFFLK